MCVNYTTAQQKLSKQRNKKKILLKHNIHEHWQQKKTKQKARNKLKFVSIAHLSLRKFPLRSHMHSTNITQIFVHFLPFHHLIINIILLSCILLIPITFIKKKK